MQFVYLLKSKKDKGLYIGCTDNIDRRLIEHNSGKVHSTKNRQPFELIYFESYTNPEAALEREGKLKQFGSSYKGLVKRLKLE